MSKQIMSSVQRESVINRIVDQAAKGCGYPVALSEAHEQAVIRERDRRYFLTLLEHSFPDDGIGQKGQSKRIIPV
jgi:NurA-like 5'-3' nuclease